MKQVVVELGWRDRKYLHIAVLVGGKSKNENMEGENIISGQGTY